MKNLSILSKTKLFTGLSDVEINSALQCLGGKNKTYSKKQTIFLEGQSVTNIGIVLEGTVNLVKSDYYGNENIVMELYPSDMFGESAVYSSGKTLPFCVVAKTQVEVLLIDASKLIAPCNNACLFHNFIIRNMLTALADKNVQLTQKVDILTKRTIRDKILSYLYGLSQKSNKKQFAVPFNRNQMADYLSVDRSALSRELANMQKENLITFTSNQFELL